MYFSFFLLLIISKEHQEQRINKDRRTKIMVRIVNNFIDFLVCIKSKKVEDSYLE